MLWSFNFFPPDCNMLKV
uniref:Uncharacterized protein n=1 Tax=Rhizophora mucronata TaxID=61149 RepID=A0A2P2NL54_RHIMU